MPVIVWWHGPFQNTLFMMKTCPLFLKIYGLLRCVIKIVIIKEKKIFALEKYVLCKAVCKWKYNALTTQTILDIREPMNDSLDLFLSTLKALIFNTEEKCRTSCFLLAPDLKNWASFGQNDFLCFGSVGLRRSGVSYIERKSLCGFGSLSRYSLCWFSGKSVSNRVTGSA